AARYLAASGGQTDIARAVYSYNHAQWYVDEVLATARLFRSGGAVTVDRLQEGLSTSSAAVDGATRDLAVAQARAVALARVEARFRRRADTAPLLSHRLDALRARERRRPARLGRARRALRDRPDDARRGRPRLDVLPHVRPRPLGSRRLGGLRRDAGRPGGGDRPRDRAAPPPPAPAADA